VSEIDPNLARIYRETSNEEPPAALDRAILAAARREAAKPERSRDTQWRSFWSRWRVPASAIATLVLGVSIALLVKRERPEPIDGVVVPEPPRVQSPLRALEPAKPAERAAGADNKKEDAQARVPAAPERARTAPAPRPAQAAPSAAEAFPDERRAKTEESKTSLPQAATRSNAARDSALGGAGVAAPRTPAATAPAPATTGRPAPLREQALQHPPEAWLEEIRRLKRAGRDKEAADELAQFRKAYPAYALPEKLLE